MIFRNMKVNAGRKPLEIGIEGNILSLMGLMDYFTF